MENSNQVTGGQHLLVWYSRKDDSPIGELPLREVGIEQLRAAFRPPEGDPMMYDSYSVSHEASKFLGKLLGIPLDLDHFDYFVECDAVDSSRTVTVTIPSNEPR